MTRATRTKNMKPAARPTPIRPGSALAEEFWRKGKSDSCPIYDMHAHMGGHYAIHFPLSTWQEMLHNMDAAGVRWAIFSHHWALFTPQLGNACAVKAVRACPGRFRAYLAVNPQYPQVIRRDLAKFDGLRDVFVGLKFLADYHHTALGDEAYTPALEFAQERKLPVLLHTWGGSPNNGAAEVRKLAAKYPAAIFLLGHSLNNRWDEATAIAREFPNTYLELTSVLGVRGAVEKLVEGAGSDRLLFGTDLPWFDEHQGIGSLLSADITDQDIHNICHRNARRILGL